MTSYYWHSKNAPILPRGIFWIGNNESIDLYPLRARLNRLFYGFKYNF